MAIVQISRITHRKGLIENLPQLAGGEFGWAVDSRRLFIGNGTLAEGAPVVGNTEILTQYSDILNLSSTYTYKGGDAYYIVQTGETSTGDVVRSMQQKFDEGSASVKDFGAVGDGVADDTAAINRALYQLFCREANEEVRRSLFFPAGIYNVSGTIKIPPYAKLYGEGANSSIIRYTNGNTFSGDGSTTVFTFATALTDVSNREFVVHVNGQPLTSGYTITSTNITFDSAPSDAEAPNNICVADKYVAVTADSLQQTGANIGNNGATAPQNIEVSSMSLETQNCNDVFLAEKLDQGYFDSVNFKGPLAEAKLSDALDDTKLITVESSTALVTKQLTFDKVHLSGATYGFFDNYNSEGITVSNSTFDTLYRGAVIGSTPVNGGPQGVRILHNLFDNIAAQGIQIGSVGYNASAFNFFKDVGNDFNGTGNPATTVISIGNSNNLSYGDLFLRTDADDESVKRIELNDHQSIALTTTKLEMGNYERTIGYVTTLVDNTSSATSIFSLDSDRVGGYAIDYTVKRGDAMRTGRITGTLGFGSNTATFNEDYTESAATGVTFSVTETGGVLSFKYTTTSTGDDATFTYSIVKFNR
jgi:hypothetical protein